MHGPSRSLQPRALIHTGYATSITHNRNTTDVVAFQALNCHSAQNNAYQVGVSEDKGTRRYMEDAHSFVVDYAGVRGQGFFAIFDGHAGKHAAEWCGGHFHEVRHYIIFDTLGH